MYFRLACRTRRVAEGRLHSCHWRHERLAINCRKHCEDSQVSDVITSNTAWIVTFSVQVRQCDLFFRQSSRVVMEIQRSYTEDPIYARVSEPTLHEPESTINNLDMPAPLGGSTPYDCRGERRLKGESSGYHSDSEIRENDYGMMTHYQWTMSRRGSCAVRESRYGALTLPRKPHSSGSSARHYHNEYRVRFFYSMSS